MTENEQYSQRVKNFKEHMRKIKTNTNLNRNPMDSMVCKEVEDYKSADEKNKINNLNVSSHQNILEYRVSPSKKKKKKNRRQGSNVFAVTSNYPR